MWIFVLFCVVCLSAPGGISTPFGDKVTVPKWKRNQQKVKYLLYSTVICWAWCQWELRIGMRIQYQLINVNSCECQSCESHCCAAPQWDSTWLNNHTYARPFSLYGACTWSLTMDGDCQENQVIKSSMVTRGECDHPTLPTFQICWHM